MDNVGTNGRLETLWCTICRVRLYRRSVELFSSVSSIRSVVSSYVGDGGRG